MKLKALALVAAVLMTASCFAACGGDKNPTPTPGPDDTNEENNGGDETDDNAEDPHAHHQIEITETPVRNLDGTASSVDTSEAVNLIWYQWGDPHTDDDMVYEKLNEMSKNAINTTVDYKFADDTKAGLIISTDEYYDIIFSCSWQANYVNNANKGVFANLDDVLPTAAPTLWNFIPEKAWNGTQVNGSIYCVPVYKDTAAAQMWNMDATLLVDAGVTDAELDALNGTLKSVTPILQKIKDNTDIEGVEAPWMHAGSTIGRNFDYVNRAAGGIGIKFENTDGHLTSLLATDEALANVTEYKYWLDNGLCNKDAMTCEAPPWSPVSIGQGWPNCEAFWKNATHGEVTIREYLPPIYATDFVLGSCHAISVNSKYVDRAVLFLQWINCDFDARNTFVYGIEGTHYNLTDEGTVEVTERGTNKYRPAMFSQATFFTTIPEAPKPLNSWDGLLQACLEAKATPLLGFTPNNELVENELAQLNTTYKQYERALNCGAVADPAAELARVLDEMNATGLQDVIDIYQEQVDEFLAAKAE